jgi:PAS domain S-box-containing protein
MVVSSDKRVFTSLHPQDVRRNVADLPGINQSWFDKSTSSQMVLDTAVGLISITPVYGFADDNTPFFVYIRASTEAAQREKQTVSGLFILGSILSVIATSAVIIIVFNTTILQRITAVLGVLQRVESGQLQARVDEPIASDEIGVLQTGVNSMVATLHQTIEALEQRVNELHEAREALYTSESRFKSLIENSYDGILLYNKEGIIQYASPSIKQILGYTAEELIGKKDSDLTAEADTAEVKTIFANLRAQPGKGTAFRQRIKHKDGTLVWLEVTGTNLLYDPHVNAIVWNFRNITKRVEQEKQIQQQERLAAVGQLAAGIAHDFNNILAVIVLYSQLALKNNQLPQALQKHLQVVAEQAQRAADLVVQILDFSRRAILERRPMDLGALLKEMVKLWRRTLPENITVSLEQDTNTPLINADPTRIQQVFMNLAVNVRDAMPDGGRLHIRIEQRDLKPGSHNLPDVAPGRWVQVAVADTGIGIQRGAALRGVWD